MQANLAFLTFNKHLLYLYWAPTVCGVLLSNWREDTNSFSAFSSLVLDSWVLRIFGQFIKPSPILLVTIITKLLLLIASAPFSFLICLIEENPSTNLFGFLGIFFSELFVSSFLTLMFLLFFIIYTLWVQKEYFYSPKTHLKNKFSFDWQWKKNSPKYTSTKCRLIFLKSLYSILNVGQFFFKKFYGFY